jgi:hypothetical protein
MGFRFALRATTSQALPATLSVTIRLRTLATRYAFDGSG